MSNTALALLNEFLLPNVAEAALPEGVTMDEFNEEFGDSKFTYPRIKMPSGGGISWEIPNPLDPDDPFTDKAIEGVIVSHNTQRTYWGEDENSKQPVCRSNDGETGRLLDIEQAVPGMGGHCATCPLSKYGSGEGGIGSACKLQKAIYIQRSGEPLPYLLSLPRTSLKAFNAYLGNLRFAGVMPSSVVTRVTLKKEQNGNGDPYSIAVFKTAGKLTPEIAAQAALYAKTIRAAVKELNAPAPAEEYTGAIPFDDPGAASPNEPY